MQLKIKGNDDRVRGATTAILLIGRARLARGQTEDLIADALAEYRDDPAGYKANKAAWPDAQELGPLTKSIHVERYQKLLLAVAALQQKMAENKRQSNSLRELDNYLIASLSHVTARPAENLSAAPKGWASPKR